jgi:hypothetical protein
MAEQLDRKIHHGAPEDIEIRIFCLSGDTDKQKPPASNHKRGEDNKWK